MLALADMAMLLGVVCGSGMIVAVLLRALGR